MLNDLNYDDRLLLNVLNYGDTQKWSNAAQVIAWELLKIDYVIAGFLDHSQISTKTQVNPYCVWERRTFQHIFLRKKGPTINQIKTLYFKLMNGFAAEKRQKYNAIEPRAKSIGFQLNNICLKEKRKCWRISLSLSAKLVSTYVPLLSVNTLSSHQTNTKIQSLCMSVSHRPLFISLAFASLFGSSFHLLRSRS